MLTSPKTWAWLEILEIFVMVDGAQHIRYPQNTKEQKIPNANRESSFFPKSNLETSFTCFFLRREKPG